jgi:hypothetical protein
VKCHDCSNKRKRERVSCAYTVRVCMFLVCEIDCYVVYLVMCILYCCVIHMLCWFGLNLFPTSTNGTAVDCPNSRWRENIASPEGSQCLRYSSDHETVFKVQQ